MYACVRVRMFSCALVYPPPKTTSQNQTNRVPPPLSALRVKINEPQKHSPSCTLSHMHTCTLSHMHTFTHAHFHTCTPAHLHTCTPAHLHTCTPAHLHTCTPAHLHTCTLAYLHTYTPAHLHTSTLAYLHTCTHAHFHTCTPAHLHTCLLTNLLTIFRSHMRKQQHILYRMLIRHDHRQTVNTNSNTCRWWHTEFEGAQKIFIQLHRFLVSAFAEFQLRLEAMTLINRII